MREDKMNPQIRTDYIHSGGATTLIFILKGANADKRSPVPRNMAVHLTARHWRTNMMLWKQVSWNPRVKVGWNNTFAQQEPFGATVMMSPSGRTSLFFIVDGANVVNSFVMRSTISRNMVVPRESTTSAYNFLRVSTQDLGGFFANETWLEQHIDATETFGAINVDVPVWKLTGLVLVDSAVDLSSVT